MRNTLSRITGLNSIPIDQMFIVCVLCTAAALDCFHTRIRVDTGTSGSFVNKGITKPTTKITWRNFTRSFIVAFHFLKRRGSGRGFKPHVWRTGARLWCGLSPCGSLGKRAEVHNQAERFDCRDRFQTEKFTDIISEARTRSETIPYSRSII